MTPVNKLERLKEYLLDGRQDHLEEIESLETRLKKRLIKADIAQNPAIAEMLTYLDRRISGFNALLQHKEDLTQEERDKIFARREEDRWLLSFFRNAEKEIKMIEQQIDFYFEGLETGDNT